METYKDREVGELRWYFDLPLTFGAILGVLALAFLVPGMILGTFRWIVARIRGPGAGGVPGL